MNFRIERLGDVDSTMDAAHARARAGAEEGLWLLAERQTAGRGRQGRSWLSPEGALAASLVLRPERRRPGLGPARAATLSFIVSLALRDALRALGLGATIALKWPNDVLVEGGKIAGVLLESEGAGPSAHLALGVGLNLRSAPSWEDLPPEALRAASLGEHGIDVAPEHALAALGAAFAPRYERWLVEGFAGQREEWLASAAGLGGPIEARSVGATLRGRFTDVDAEGALVIDTGRGRKRVLAADVFLPGAG